MQTSPRSPLVAYLQLFRLPNVFTAAADVLMGYLIAHGRFVYTPDPFAEDLPGHLPSPGEVALLVAASCLMYVAGMVLNDVFDIEQDTRERPHRPIPSGRIHPGFALNLGRVMLLGGVGCGWAATIVSGDSRCGLVATALAVLVYLYDRILKRTPLGPLGMGGCRFLNVLLGMSTAAVAWQKPHFAAAAGIAVYIVGVTWFARTEAVASRRIHLVLATLVMLAGLVPLYLMPQLETDDVRWQFVVPSDTWPVFWAMVAVMSSWRCVWAIVDPSPQLVQGAVKQAIFSLFLLDAAAAFPAGGMQVLAILLLMFPARMLGTWIYST